VEPGSSRLVVTVTDGRGRAVADRGLARWLSRLAPGRVRGEVAIALVSDAHVRKLNGQYRGKDAPTDVLSFPGEDSERVPSAFRRKTSEPRFLGDLVIATGVARRQAREHGHSYATELRVLALHGFLHLLGYDHEDRNDHGRMARAEARLRRRGGLRVGLIARAGEALSGKGPQLGRRLRPARAAGSPAGAAPARASARGWGPARKK
jgi:probable rRNA maturation factor